MTEIVASHNTLRIISKYVNGNINYFLEGKKKNHFGEDIWIPYNSDLEYANVTTHLRAFDRINISIGDILLFIIQAKKEVLDTFSNKELSSHDSREYLKEHMEEVDNAKQGDVIFVEPPENDIPF